MTHPDNILPTMTQAIEANRAMVELVTGLSFDAAGLSEEDARVVRDSLVALFGNAQQGAEVMLQNALAVVNGADPTAKAREELGELGVESFAELEKDQHACPHCGRDVTKVADA